MSDRTINYVPPSASGALNQDELLDFLARPWNARLATVTAENRPYVVPVWYAYDVGGGGSIFHVVARERAAYLAHIRQNPAVALHIADDLHAAHTRVLVEGNATLANQPVAPAASPHLQELVDDMARRYMGEPGPGYAAQTMDRPRVLITITPLRWQSWSGGEWASHYWK